MDGVAYDLILVVYLFIVLQFDMISSSPDCPNNGLCCFDGCADRCLDAPSQGKPVWKLFLDALASLELGLVSDSFRNSLSFKSF